MYRAKFGDGFVGGALDAAEIAAFPDAALLRATLLRNDLSAVAVATVKNTPGTIHTVFAGDGPVVIPERGLPGSFSFTHMLKVHALRSLNRLLIEAYGALFSRTFAFPWIGHWASH